MHQDLTRPLMPSETVPTTPYWNLQEPAHTHYLNALSLLLPGAEQFMMNTCQDVLGKPEWRERLSEPLIRSIEQFMLEEQAHQHAHTRYNQRLLQTGYTLSEQQSRLQDIFEELAGLPLIQRVCLMNGFEHITARLAKHVIDRPRLLTRQASPQSQLWHWHCQEEIAHQPVVTRLVSALKIPSWRLTGWTLLSCVWLYSDMRSLVGVLRRQDMAQGRLTHMRWLQSTTRLVWAMLR